MARYIVTGGAGFIGSHLVEDLCRDGHEVTILDDFSTGKRANVQGLETTIHEGTICSALDVAQAMDGCDGVFHLAAIASVSQSVDEWSHTHQINQSGAVEVFEQAARKSIPVVYASSAAVYGDCEALPLSETGATNPLTPYGLDKLACEWQARVGQHILGLRSVGLRFFNVYGPRQDPLSPYSGVISIFAEKCRTNTDIVIFGDGCQSRDFIYVMDVVAHLRAAMERLQGERINCDVLNVCTQQQQTVTALAELLQKVSGASNVIRYDEERVGDIRFSCGSNDKSIRILNVKALTPLEKGLETTWQCLK